MLVTALEILKYILPSLVVFGAVYYVQKQHLQSEIQLKAMDTRSKYSKDARQLKLQAYERLLLFCHRIDLPNLILRLNAEEISGVQLKNSMVISVQKEYEHNLAQQLYVSPKLWDIITLAKNNVIDMITSPSQISNESNTAMGYASVLLNDSKLKNNNPVQLAVKAIKEEAKIILDV